VQESAGTFRKVQESAGTFRKLQESAGTFRNMQKSEGRSGGEGPRCSKTLKKHWFNVGFWEWGKVQESAGTFRKVQESAGTFRKLQESAVTFRNMQESEGRSGGEGPRCSKTLKKHWFNVGFWEWGKVQESAGTFRKVQESAGTFRKLQKSAGTFRNMQGSEGRSGGEGPRCSKTLKSIGLT